MNLDRAALEKTLSALRNQLLACRSSSGHWVGELSSSALSTATAISALTLVDKALYADHLRRGLDWLARNRNPDGGWGDTILSASNISTTALCWSAFGLAADQTGPYRDVIQQCESWLKQRAGSLEPESLARAIIDRYGADRTFSAPILVNCALGGRLGTGTGAWRWAPSLPFELAVFPQRWYKWLRLPVVSYALPALIAIGIVQHHHRPTRNPIRRVLRRLSELPSLKILTKIQPSSGGFLEAVPLTSFVVMSLAAGGHRIHGVVRRGVDFLTTAVREDGSWPIDTNLSTWVTTLSVNALAANSNIAKYLSAPERARIRDWLLGQQYSRVHPYTLADPGGWAWTDLPGGVPDADDTSGALLALRNLGFNDEQTKRAAAAAVKWLMGLQNRDGGVPTFCRGWGTLPFDRSGPDITAHALRAVSSWLGDLPPQTRARAKNFVQDGIRYLSRTQRKDGSWFPLWFGNERAGGEENATYGTSRVLLALAELRENPFFIDAGMIDAATVWILSAQNPDRGWGGAPSIRSSIEETALAVEALLASAPADVDLELAASAIAGGVEWLIKHTNKGKVCEPSPIGFYFAKLWYYERLYPLIFSVAALERAGDSHHNPRIPA
jgi:squalene-hopene/tetraprenyl-beta-curcumene cyclase